MKRRSLLSLSLAIAACAFFPARSQAQQSNPDYSGVKDILGGRRFLLSVNDLVIGGSVLKTSEGTKIEDKNISELPGFDRKEGGPEIMARLFDSKSDTLVYANGKTVYAIDPNSQKTTGLTLDDNFHNAGIASGDFLGNGLQEIVIASPLRIRVVSAVDPVDFSKGLYSGPPTGTENGASPTSRIAVAVGDFAGDGHPAVAIAYEAFFQHQRRLDIYQVDPQTLALELRHTETFTQPDALSALVAVTLAAGRFGSTLHD